MIRLVFCRGNVLQIVLFILDFRLYRRRLRIYMPRYIIRRYYCRVCVFRAEEKLHRQRERTKNKNINKKHKPSERDRLANLLFTFVFFWRALFLAVRDFASARSSFYFFFCQFEQMFSNICTIPTSWECCSWRYSIRFNRTWLQPYYLLFGWLRKTKKNWMVSKFFNCFAFLMK